jgi:hypothetical protein
MPEQLKSAREVKKNKKTEFQTKEVINSGVEKIDSFGEKSERITSLRLHLAKAYRKENTTVFLPARDRECIEQEAIETASNLNKCYKEGFGIFPSSDPEASFYNTVWSRDLAHAGGNFFTGENIKPLLSSLKTIFSHQKEDGSLPYRVEKKRFLLEHTPRVLFGIDFNILKKIGIDLITRKTERPVYEGEDGGNAEDTIPSIVVTLGEAFISSKEGREFVKTYFDEIKQAMDRFAQKTDPQDGLEISQEANPDWADSLLRGNKKISTINIWYARALRMMRLISEELGKNEESKMYEMRSRKVKKGILEKLYDKENHYFRTGEGEDRIDAAASVFGCLYILPATEAALVQETMKKRLSSKSGLKNFDPPYPQDRIYPILKLIGMGGYHNESVWPWITAQNIQAKIKIAQEHPDEHVREKFRKESVEDLLDVAKLFKEAGGAYEVFDPDTRQPTTKLRTGMRKYNPPKNFMGNLATYQGAYKQLKKLGWI